MTSATLAGKEVCVEAKPYRRIHMLISQFLHPNSRHGVDPILITSFLYDLGFSRDEAREAVKLLAEKGKIVPHYRHPQRVVWRTTEE